MKKRKSPCNPASGDDSRGSLLDSIQYSDVPEAPVYYPNLEEFKDCLGYLRSIAPEASRYGICKVVPPKEWQPSYSFPFEEAFPCKKQVLAHRKNDFIGEFKLSKLKAYSKVDVEEVQSRNLKSLLNFEKTLRRQFVKPYLRNSKDAPTDDLMERLYWKWFLSKGRKTTLYASDIEGSAFACREQNDSLGKGWNLRNIARNDPGAILQYMTDVVPGVTDPMLYIAILFSTFCWHYEDNFLYSVSYNHHGSSRTWYGIPGSDYVQTEKIALSQILPGKFQEEDHLRLKSTMFTPGYLVENGVPVYKCYQRPRDFIFTFPGAYHSGFSHGFSVSESVNFALADWLPWGKQSIDLYARVQRLPVIPYEELVIRITKQILEDKLFAKKRSRFPQISFVIDAMKSLVKEERLLRQRMLFAGSEGFQIRTPQIEYCHSCKQAMALSFFTCGCNPYRLLCFKHLNDHQQCSSKGFRDLITIVRYTIFELQELTKAIDTCESFRY